MLIGFVMGITGAQVGVGGRVERVKVGAERGALYAPTVSTEYWLAGRG